MKQQDNNCIESSVYTVEEMQMMLNISRKTAYELVKDPPFPVRRILNQYRIPKTAFHQWLNNAALDSDGACVLA